MKFLRLLMMISTALLPSIGIAAEHADVRSDTDIPFDTDVRSDTDVPSDTDVRSDTDVPSDTDVRSDTDQVGED